MAPTFLSQIEEWTSELERLAALTPSHSDVREELRATIETLEAQFSSVENETLPTQRLLSDTESRPTEAGLRGLFTTSPNGIIQEANAVGEVLLNFPSQWLLGQPMIVFVAATQRRLFLEKLLYFKHYRRLQVEWHLMLQAVNGPAFPAVINVSKTLGHDRELLRLIWLVRPIST